MEDMMTTSTTSAFDPYAIYFPSNPSSFTYSNYSTPMQSPSFYPAMNYNTPLSNNSSEQNSNGRSDEKKRSRRYKTPSPQILRIRRTAANERERKRMNTLNVAYDKLRTVLPEIDSGRRLSKFETLQMAQEYINSLSEILKTSSNGQSSSSSSKKKN